jgi:uncharacterized protein (TIGR00299 family) protein
VHFHEVGAADSIVDMVCTSYLFTLLAPTAVFATPLALGNGTLLCAHGELPVPAPATARLIEGLPVYASAHDGELTTPTGAALARTFVTHWEPLPLMRPVAFGYGAGTRELSGTANVVRVLVGEDAGGEDFEREDSDAVPGFGRGPVCGPTPTLRLEGCLLLETNIDHLSAEALAFACEELLTAGALDVWQEPIVMKKGRLAVRLSALIHPLRSLSFIEKMMAVTGSLGVRRRFVERVVTPREIVVYDTPYGPVPFKVARFLDPSGSLDSPDSSNSSRPSGPSFGSPSPETSAPIWLRPEHDTLARIAREYQINYAQLAKELQQYVRL